MDSAANARLPIGIFDSGVGGLTVLAALRRRLPGERYCYLGDTARLPYGTKSRKIIARYSLQATEKLVERCIKLLVVACNTATAAALPELQKAYAPLPIVGVVEPGAQAACRSVPGTPDSTILVLGTESTIRGKAYTRAIHALNPAVRVIGVPCTLFVPLAEEGWMSGPIAEAIAERYLAPVLADLASPSGGAGRPDCVVLGCTHFPPLASAITAVVGREAVMVDSAATTAEAVADELTRLNLLNPGDSGAPSETERDGQDIPHGLQHADGTNGLHFLTTDAPERFARVGSLFLGTQIDPGQLELVTL